MHAVVRPDPGLATPSAISDWTTQVQRGLEQRRLSPYLGPGILTEASGGPTSYDALAEYFSRKCALPRRARGNPWASAQFIESRKHRSIVEAYMVEAFSASLSPLPLHRFAASLSLPLIVDTWYDGAMRAALGDAQDWVEVQGGSRAAVGEERYFRTYAPSGAELGHAAGAQATTVLYKPHGAVAPARNFLISDADYVEVLTEIDIQTPIPLAVQARRRGLGFVFLGCRFFDQTLRIFARQIVKRSAGPHFALIDPSVRLTNNERKFLAELGAHVVIAPQADVIDRLVR